MVPLLHVWHQASLKAIVHHLEQQRCDQRHCLGQPYVFHVKRGADEDGHVVNAVVEVQLKSKVGKRCACMFICNPTYMKVWLKMLGVFRNFV